MLKRFSVIMMLMALCWSALAIERRHGILVGVVLRLDATAKTVVVKLGDRTERTFHVVKRTTVHGTQEAAAGAKGAFHGLKEGSEVAVHYTAKGTQETAEEIDNIGKDGLKATEATVTHLDRGAKTLVVKTADGVEETYRLTDSAARDAGKDIAEGIWPHFYAQEMSDVIAHLDAKNGGK